MTGSLYIEVNWRPEGIPTKTTIMDAAAAGWSSRHDESSLELFDTAIYDECVEFLKKIIEWKHTSVLEHIVFKFAVSVSVACASQVTRHRIASYTQKSFRVRRDFDETSFLVPPQIEPSKQVEWIEDMFEHIRIYKKWLEYTKDVDVARYHLPQGLKTNLAITINARSLRNMLEQRLSKYASFEFQDMMKQILHLIDEEDLYFLFSDIIEEGDTHIR